jgi:hypothetical protein
MALRELFFEYADLAAGAIDPRRGRIDAGLPVPRGGT